MQDEVFDLYSKQLLVKAFEPTFHKYYNVDFRDGFIMPVHSHKFIEIMYIRKGSCDVYVDEVRFRLEPGDFILLNGLVPHRLHVDKKTRCKVLCLEFYFKKTGRVKYSIHTVYEHTKEARKFLSEKHQVVKLKDTEEVYSALMDIYREIERNELMSNIIIETAFCNFLVKLSRLFCENDKLSDNPSNRYISNAISYMNNNYYEEVTIEQVADSINLNVSYFHKIFKKETGTTPMNFLNSIRINKAKIFLERSDIPIIEICNFVGFNSRQYFSCAFKHETGLTPRQYRLSCSLKNGPSGNKWHCEV